MIEIDASQAIAGLSLYVDRFASIHLLLEEIGHYEVTKARDRIQDTKKDPWGGMWEPWAKITEQERIKKDNAMQGLLWDTGHLLNSIRFEVFGSTVEIGTDVDYAVELQNGRHGMPARPFLGWDEKAIPEIEYAALTFFEGK